MKLLKILLLASVVLSNNLIAAEPILPPDKVAQDLMSKIVEPLKNKQKYYKTHPKELSKVAQSLLVQLNGNLDMARISWSIVGRVWRGATKAQKRAFIHEFRVLLVNTYVRSLLKYVDKKVTYLPYRNVPNRRKAIVRSFVIDNGKKLPITYRLYKSKKYGWRVYDVTIVGISLVRNYKSSFKRTVRKSGIVGLIKALQKKNANN